MLTARKKEKKKDASFETSFRLVQLAKLVELQGHSALLVSCVILVKNTLGSCLVNSLYCNFVSAIGLGAIAFFGSSLELLDGGLQCGLISLVAGIADFCHQNTLLSRLNIRQTKHLLGGKFSREQLLNHHAEWYFSKELPKNQGFFEKKLKFLNISTRGVKNER